MSQGGKETKGVTERRKEETSEGWMQGLEQRRGKKGIEKGEKGETEGRSERKEEK